MPERASETSRPIIAPAVVYGFGAAVAMWIVGYFTHMPGVRTPAWLVGTLMSACQIAAGMVMAGGRPRPDRARTMLAAALAGLITSMLNLMIVFSTIATPQGEGQPNELVDGWHWVILGTLAFGPAACAIGALIGTAAGGARTGLVQGASSGGTGEPPAQNVALAQNTGSHWLGRLAIVAVFSVIPVLFSGGLVTSAEAGLAVPDYPTSYNALMFLYPLADMTGGIYYEHAHRLFGSLAGFTMIALLVASFVWSKRRACRTLAVVALLAVIAQGLLGGYRVTAADETAPAMSPTSTADNFLSIALAMTHGVTGQLFFGFMCFAAAAMSPAWARWTQSPPEERRSDRLAAALAKVTLCVLALQLVLGAGLRHSGNSAMPQSFLTTAFMHSHITVSLLVMVIGSMAAFRARARHNGHGKVRLFGTGLLHSLNLQFVLGIATLFLVLPYNDQPDSRAAMIVATVHQVNGALVLAMATLLCAWAVKLRAEPGTSGANLAA